jgi:secreted trypsin-like serine protease
MTRDHAAPTTFSFLLLSLAFSFVDASPLKDFPHQRAVSSGFQRSQAWFDVGSSANDTLARTNGRIANGQYAAKGQFPYAARMMIGTGNSVYTCGGVLIGSRVVLTAAHCVTDNDGALLDPGLIQLKIGVVDTSKSSPIYRVRSTITPMYNPYTMWGDVALLELSRPAKSPAARATLAPASRSVKSGSLITVMGWYGKSMGFT